jgi:cytoskeleton protein RodZ
VNSEAGGEEARAIGARLRAARERKGLTILQAAERLHVDPRVLESLEAQDFAALGPEVYVRGHLRRYAELLGEPGGELLAQYASGRQAEHPDLTRIPRGSPPADASRVMLPVMLLVVGCAAAGAVWWLMSLPRAKAQPVLTSPAPAAVTAPQAGADAAPQSPAAPGDSGAAAGAAVPGVPAAQAVTVAASGEARLALSFSAASWVDVSDAGGRRLLQGLIDAGATRSLSGAAPLRLVIGNARGVVVEVNGKPVTLAGLVRRDGSARLLIDEAGHAAVAPPRLAHGD